MGLNIFIAIVFGMLLYANTISIVKKMKSGENTDLNTIFGCLLTGFILYCIFTVCSK